MKEKKTESEKTIVIDIKLTRGLVVALSCVLTVVALLAYLTLTGKSAAASEAETAQAASTGMRQFYLTFSDEFDGSEALTACAAGYHMASLWELADPSNLKYYTRLGYKQDDSGQGPPSSEPGWVRTGYASSTEGLVGQDNCAVWTSPSVFAAGSRALLPDEWTAGNQSMGVWVVAHSGCDWESRVWCIED